MRVWLRRVVAVAVLGAGVFAAWYLVASALDSGSTTAARPQPEPTTTALAAAPPPKPLRIVFPEGFTREQMAARITDVKQIALRKRRVRTPRLTAAGYLKATASWRTPSWFEPKSARRPLEGFLFPATYDFDRRTTGAQLAAKQLAAFRSNWRRVDLRYAAARNLTPYDVLKIASLVESEVQVPRERKLVAAVIYNRLRKGITLGVDAAIRYGLHVPPTESLRQSQLEDPTPYNTRIHYGLPPTPISNPGLAALQAAAHPAQVDYLFYARNKDCKTHYFTADASQFRGALC